MPLYWVTSATDGTGAGQFDAVELVEPGTGLLAVRRILMWQTSELGDAAEEIARCEWIRGHTTSGSGGQTTVITPLNSFDTAATFTAEVLNTNIASGGSPVRLAPVGWNLRIPLDVLYPPDEYIIARNGERLVFRIVGAGAGGSPADEITVNAACLVEQN